MKNIVILISGRGSNMQALVETVRREGWDARVCAVISNVPTAKGLDYAKEQGIATAVVNHKDHADRESFDAEMTRVIDGFKPDVVVLAGFMRILTAGFVEHYKGCLINVHPSLLPAFTGLHTHERAIEMGCKWAGVTVHLVTAELDHGPIIIQAAVPVRCDDTADTLSARVLACEHVIYPKAVRWLLEDQLEIDGLKVYHRSGEPQWMVGEG